MSPIYWNNSLTRRVRVNALFLENFSCHTNGLLLVYKIKKHKFSTFITKLFSGVYCQWTKLWERAKYVSMWGSRLAHVLCGLWRTNEWNCSIVGSFLLIFTSRVSEITMKKIYFLPSLDVGQSDIKCDFLLHTPTTCVMICLSSILTVVFPVSIWRKQKEKGSTPVSWFSLLLLLFPVSVFFPEIFHLLPEVRTNVFVITLPRNFIYMSYNTTNRQVKKRCIY